MGNENGLLGRFYAFFCPAQCAKNESHFARCRAIALRNVSADLVRVSMMFVCERSFAAASNNLWMSGEAIGQFSNCAAFRR